MAAEGSTLFGGGEGGVARENVLELGSDGGCTTL